MSKAKALGLAGSPRENSNTEFFVNVALEELKEAGVETEIIPLQDKKVEPCIACYKCWEGGETVGECRQETDDDFREIYEKMKGADAIIVGSPVNYSCVHSKLWALLTRVGFPNYSTDTFTRKIGGPITVARRAGHNLAFSQLLLWFFINDFIIPGSSYWNVGVAGSGAARDAKEDKEGIETIKNFAQNVAWLLEKTQSR